VTYIELLNLLFKAHREKDIVAETIILQELDEREPDFADTLDAINY
jgi:hypothetical protein